MILGCHHNSPKRAFGIPEVLVTVAVVGVLLGIISPIAQDCLVRGRIAQGVVNLRATTTATQSYSLDNDGAYPQTFQDDKKSWIQELWPSVYPDRKFPGHGHKLKGTIFYTPMIESGDDARTYGLNVALQKNFPTRQYQLVGYASQTVLFADTKNSSALTGTQINARNRGAAGASFIDGHIELIPTSLIPNTGSSVFWSGKTSAN